MKASSFQILMRVKLHTYSRGNFLTRVGVRLGYDATGYATAPHGPENIFSHAVLS